jgi:hypothetical protein
MNGKRETLREQQALLRGAWMFQSSSASSRVGEDDARHVFARESCNAGDGSVARRVRRSVMTVSLALLDDLPHDQQLQEMDQNLASQRVEGHRDTSRD